MTKLMRACAWCPPVRRRAVECTAALLGRRVTHGICPRCQNRFLADLGPRRVTTGKESEPLVGVKTPSRPNSGLRASHAVGVHS